MKRVKDLLAISAFALLILGVPTIASAQWDRDRDDDDRYGNNRRDDDYYGNSRYNRNIRGTIQNLKNRSANFERHVERADGRRDDRWDDRNDRWGGHNDRSRNRNRDLGRLEQLAERFRDAAGDLANAYGNGRDMNGSRDEARRVLDYGRQLEQELYNSRVNRNLQNQWNHIRQDLSILENFYGNSRYNNRNRNTGDWRNRIPFPLPF